MTRKKYPGDDTKEKIIHTTYPRVDYNVHDKPQAKRALDDLDEHWRYNFVKELDAKKSTRFRSDV